MVHKTPTDEKKEEKSGYFYNYWVEYYCATCLKYCPRGLDIETFLSRKLWRVAEWSKCMTYISSSLRRVDTVAVEVEITWKIRDSTTRWERAKTTKFIGNIQCPCLFLFPYTEKEESLLKKKKKLFMSSLLTFNQVTCSFHKFSVAYLPLP